MVLGHFGSFWVVLRFSSYSKMPLKQVVSNKTNWRIIESNITITLISPIKKSILSFIRYVCLVFLDSKYVGFFLVI